MINTVPVQRINGLQKFALVGMLAVSVFGIDSNVLKPQRTNAAPFMANSLAGLENAFAGNDMLTKGISMLSAICYWIPVIALLVGVGAGAASRDAQSGEGFKTVIGIVVAAWFTLGVLWLYDTYGVPQGSTQRGPTRAEVPHFVIATIARG